MLSVIIPAKDEAGAIASTIESLRTSLTAAGIVHEIIVVDDGSSDDTGAIARAAGVVTVRHPTSGGYGRSLKDGIKRARYDLIGITDADGTYPNDRMAELYRLVADDGFDMAVGARKGPEYRGTFLKMPARRLFLWLSEYAAGRPIDDINSGLRVFRKEICLRYIHTISDGFSFTTTITLASLLNGYFVRYVPIDYFKRVGSSHVRYYRDTLRTFQIIVESILYYNPLKLFLLVVAALFGLSAAAVALHLAAPGLAPLFLPLLSATALPAAFVVGAIGLSADLNRSLQRRLVDARDVAPPPPPGQRQP